MSSRNFSHCWPERGDINWDRGTWFRVQVGFTKLVILALEVDETTRPEEFHYLNGFFKPFCSFLEWWPGLLKECFIHCFTCSQTDEYSVRIHVSQCSKCLRNYGRVISYNRTGNRGSYLHA